MHLTFVTATAHVCATTRGDADKATQNASRGQKVIRDQRLLYCGALRAFFRPYFLRSVARGSRVRKPAFFSGGPVLGLDQDQRPGDAQAQRAGLAGRAAAVQQGDRCRSFPAGRR